MPDKKLTDNEIKKALECCVNNTNENCNKCVCSGSNVSCVDVLLTNALDLINRLQAENERLKKSNRNWRRKVQRLRKKVEVEIDKLNAEKNDVMYYKDQIKAEAYKEFAERVKLRFSGTLSCSGGVIKRSLDNLLKELVGDDK